ncbi:hypothetical protein GCWU000341_02363 [Oribacterium sp. oral taxon 078 str. F0262]|uniref:Wadjet anti-phage system protein JetA family protein n=1 Tax=Oribacterium sp. oral taxon 078 TaxID=652706 RepID=UPI0001BCBA9A|nr:Wadjet anti-phage system protein JetA family protein [Oribacterium sp. oral taxon 078]EFE90861.1 hypothetical protein GCWU000341_02363 [Oribacterium sp. oral taxon 078 str. F0262]
MRIFEIIPERFFSILSAQKKELYVDALMVLRTAFKTELLIRRPELFSMMLDSLEDSFLSADFSEEAMEIGEEGESQDLSGKVHLLLRKLRDCGWIEIEYEPGSFEEIVTVPDYAVAFMDLLYDFPMRGSGSTTATYMRAMRRSKMQGRIRTFSFRLF